MEIIMRYPKEYFFRVMLGTLILILFLGCGERTKAIDNKEGGTKLTNKDSIHHGIDKSRLMLPDFSLLDLEGKEYRLTDYLGKKPVILAFWTTGCPYCITEIPRMNRIFLDRSKDLAFLSINIMEPKRTVKRLVEAKGIKFPVLLDTQGMTVRAYRIRGVPTFIVIDINGSMGYYGHDLSEAIKKIEGLLG